MRIHIGTTHTTILGLAACLVLAAGPGCDWLGGEEPADHGEASAEHAMDHGTEAAAVTDMAHHDHAAMEPGEPMPGASIYQVDATWQTAAGKTVTLGELAGRPRVLAMIYTSCEHVCPLIVEHMKRLRGELSEAQRERVGFVLVSFDPERDSVAALQEYADKKDLDPDHWTLLRGNAKDVRTLAAVLGVKYRQLDDGSFSHSNTITLLTPGGEIAAQRQRMNESFDAVIQALDEMG